MKTLYEFIIPHDGKYINEIYLDFNLANYNDIVYKLIEKVSIELHDQIIYNVNGLILKILMELNRKPNDLHNHNLIQNKFILPLFLSYKIPIGHIIGYPILKIKLNDKIINNSQINVNALVNYSDGVDMEENKVIKVNTYHEKRIEINENDHEYEYTCEHEMDSQIEYFLFYIEGDIEIENVLLNMNSTFFKTYIYEEMNTLFPYLRNKLCNFNSDFPNNLMMVSFMNYPDFGLDLRRLDSMKLKFKFRKNNGGNIYVITSNTNVAIYGQNHFYFKRTEKITIDEWKQINLIDYSTNNDTIIDISI